MSFTNTPRSDGFGAQYQSIIMAAVYCELNNLEFSYTPITSMEHNYDNEPNFIEKKEDLMNIKNNFSLSVGNNQNIDILQSYKFCESNLDKFYNSNTLNKIKRIFRENKQNPFTTDNNIAIHIRRTNIHDSRNSSTTPDEYFERILSFMVEKYPTYNIHIYSQGDINHFRDSFKSFPQLIFHLNGAVEDTFIQMVYADILVTCQSSFSYTAGLISNGVVYYIPFWHPPLSHWVVLN